MNAAADLDSETDRLVSLVDAENPFDYDYAEMLPRQLAAIDERFQDRVQKIKLLQNRAETGAITEVRQLADVVPLLFAHTAYKSYPEGWLSEQKWDRMGRWLDTVSTNRVAPMDTNGVQGLDDWLQRLEGQGHYVSCSSGTTGKCAMMNAVMSDLQFSGHSLLQGLVWQGLGPNHDRKMISLGQVAATPRNQATGRPMFEAISRPDAPPFTPKAPPITIGGITEMVVLRKKMAEGTAKPGEIAYYEAQAAEREKAMESCVEQAADALIESREMKLHIMGLFAPLYRVAELVRARGYSGKDFHPENSCFISGGLKRAVLPADYREFVFGTFNLSGHRICQSYGMQELNTNAVRCKCDRYHMAPWTVLLPLDEAGETLVERPASGEFEARAAFFDLSLEGRWGGVISGDKIRISYDPCACGARSPSIHEDIQRYADMAGGDKIACAGTIDAYVRGVA
ncbi:hypothetical protein LJR219_003744 [Phenylobacterium sp. LjRoot219]|uniref:hypothetical protein n=1 Tax=Phenylobacterium sp. LjRoot219 TaxID=3342283 RepID=UPI003ECFB5B2